MILPVVAFRVVTAGKSPLRMYVLLHKNGSVRVEPDGSPNMTLQLAQLGIPVADREFEITRAMFRDLVETAERQKNFSWR
jgi:hypothetical protein